MGTHGWYCKPGQESMEKDHRGEVTAIILLSQYLSPNLLTAYLCLHRLLSLMLLLKEASFNSGQRLKQRTRNE